MGKIDKEALLERTDLVRLIDSYVPLTKAQGSEYEACCPFHTEATPSFKVNPVKGFYHCFGCGAHGNAIDFVMQYRGLGFVDACRELGADVGGESDSSKAGAPLIPAPAKAAAELIWVPVLPVPKWATPAPKAHPVRGLPEAVYIYDDAAGQLLGYIFRLIKSDGGKEMSSLTWCRKPQTGAEEWRWVSFPIPRPLYGLSRLAQSPDLPVLFVEGEKCVDRAVSELPGMVPVTLPGGGKAVEKTDFSALAGRTVYLWADCDAKREKLTPDETLAIVDDGAVSAMPMGKERTAALKLLIEAKKPELLEAQAKKPILPEDEQPGWMTMRAVANKLVGLGCTLYWVSIPSPGTVPDGFDVADEIEAGLRGETLQAAINDRSVLICGDGVSAGDAGSPVPSEGDSGHPSEQIPNPELNTESENPTPTPTGGGGAAIDAQEPKKTSKAAKAKKPIDWGRYEDLLNQFVLIYGTDTCYDLERRMLLKVNHLRLAYGSDYVKMWLGSDQRRMIMPDQLVFDPSNQVQYPLINLFDGFPIPPVKGDIQPIMELLHHLCADSADTPEAVESIVRWVLLWLALPLQKPGTKMRSALVFHGPQGAGKNLFFEITAAIYGRYALVVGQEQLEDKFNDWASQKLFLIGDEVVARAELYHQKNKLKAFITGETIQINTKMMPLRTEANHVNVVFLSNELQPLALEDSDRRYFVIYTPPRRTDDLYRRVADCLASGGASAFYEYLLSLDLAGFTEFDHPPMTKAKRDLIELGLKPPERFIREWLAGVLPLPLQVCSAGQLYRVFQRWCVLTGERFFPNQVTFSKSISNTIKLLSRRMGAGKDVLNYKVIKLDDPVNGQKSARMWVPDGCAAPDGINEGRWAADCVAGFEAILSNYCASSKEAK